MNLLRKPFVWRYDNAVLYLIGINILVFLAQFVFDSPRNPWLTWALSLNVSDVLDRGQVWGFFTYMFTHGSVQHLLFNMLGLFFFGTAVEKQMGTKEFLLFYIGTGFLAGLASFLFYLATGADYIQLLGASGVVYAILFAYAVFFPTSRIYIWGILPIRAPLLVAIYTAITIFSMLGGSGGGVAHLTHLAGFVFAWLWFPVRFAINPFRSLLGGGSWPGGRGSNGRWPR